MKRFPPGSISIQRFEEISKASAAGLDPEAVHRIRMVFRAN